MRKVVVYIVLAVLVVNCSQFGKPKKPDNLIPKNEMVAVLVDLALLSSAKGVNKKTLENAGISPEDFVYKTHEIDSLQFLNSNKYYSYNTEDYDVILKRVEDSLNKLKKKYNDKIKKDDTKVLNTKKARAQNSSADSVR